MPIIRKNALTRPALEQVTAIGIAVVFGSALHAQAIHVRGRVSNGAGQPVADAVVELVQQGIKDTTGADGAYSLTKPGVPTRPNPASPTGMRLESGVLGFTVGIPSRLKIEIFDVNGNLQKQVTLPKAQPGVYQVDIMNIAHSQRMLFIQASVGPLVQTFRYFPSKRDIPNGDPTFASPRSGGGTLAKIAAVVDTLKVTAAGFSPKKIGLSSFDSTVNVALDASRPADGVPKVTPQNATSIPAMYGNPVANPGKWNEKSYQAYYYNANGSASDIFKAPVKQGTPITKPVNIYTPPGYDPNTQYPCIVILHGIGNNEDRWNELAQPKLVPFFDNLIASKATKPFIAVFPNGTTGGANNAAGYYAFGGELMNDLIPYLEANYSIKKDRGSRALAGYSFGGMQTINIGLCAHLKDFAWFAGLHAAGGNYGATDIARYVAAQNPQAYPLHYFYISVGSSDGVAGSSSAASANGLASKGPHITSANFSFQNNIPGGHAYPSAQVGLYNFLRMAFSPNY